MHLRHRPPLIIILLTCLIAGVLLPVTAAPALSDGTVLYAANFSQADDWVTNSKERFYLENETGRYHYLIEGGTGGYSVCTLPEKVNGQFTLEFEVTPVKTDDGASFRFGIGTDKKDSQRGPLIMVTLANKKDGKLFYLQTVSKENALVLVGSSPSTGGVGSAVRFEDNTTYQVKLTYYATDNRVSMVVKEAGSPDVIYTSSAPVSGKIEDLDHLFLTALGDGDAGPQAEGYIDTVKLTLPAAQPTETPTEVAAPEVTVVAALDTITPDITPESTPVHTPAPPSRTSLPSPPTSTPTPTPTPKSGVSALLLVPSLAGAALIIRWRRDD